MLSSIYACADCDPKPDQRFTDVMFDFEASEYQEIDITDKIFYINAATGVTFIFNSAVKNDSSFCYGYKPIVRIPLSGMISR